MGLYESRGNLQKAFKDLVTKWQLTKATWNDAQAEQIEKETLEHLEKDLRAAGDAMDSMKLLISAARRECQQS